MRRRTMLIASSLALAPVLAFAQPSMEFASVDRQKLLQPLQQTSQTMSNIGRMLCQIAQRIIGKTGA